jgi:hypothetical protein
MPPAQPQATPPQVQPATYTVSDPASVFDNGEAAKIPFGPAIWGGADYLLWFVKPMHTPSLVDSISGAQTGQTNFQGSQISQLYPTSGDKFNPLNGIRGTLGFWLSEAQVVGIEASYSTFIRSSVNDFYGSSAGTILARPFIDADTGAPSFVPAATLTGTNGSVLVATSLRTQGGDANFLINAVRSGNSQLNVLLGGRYFDLSEKLEIAQQSADLGTNFTSQSYDQFGTHNKFYGGQLGLRWSYDGPTFFVAATGKIAFGAVEETVRINGATSASNDGMSSFTNGGVLAAPTNIGSFTRTRTAFLPEFTGCIGYHITPWATATVGYNFLYVTNVVRPGNQIDLTVNPENLPFGTGSPTALRPQFQFRDESIWLQGINAGLTFTY